MPTNTAYSIAVFFSYNYLDKWRITVFFLFKPIFLDTNKKYVRVYVHMNIYMQVGACVYMHRNVSYMYIYAGGCICRWVHLCVHVQVVQISVYADGPMYTHMHVCICRWFINIYTNRCMSVYISVCICTCR